ncbi:MAG: hypothetical protein GXP35_13580 [Actinobacteria bacterium]|nr:hypothetical protein [Actinomycetota bacterium]
MASAQRSEFVVPLHDLRRRSHQRRDVTIDGTIDSLIVAGIELDGRHKVTVRVVIESVADGVSVAGMIDGRWQGPCNLCLDQVGGTLDAEVAELFKQNPVDDDSYKLDRDHIDLEPMVREALALELPLLARCPFGGVGVCERVPTQLTEPELDDSAAPDETTIRGGGDPRWAALDAISFEPTGPQDAEN